VEFERTLEEHPEAQADKEIALKLGGLLRSHGAAPALTNPDFFNHQLLGRIEAEEKEAPRSESTGGSFARWFLRPFPWAVACCVALGLVVYQRTLPPPERFEKFVTPPVAIVDEAPYSAEIVSAESTDPDISVTPIHSDKDNVTVLWVDGLNYLPASYHVE